MKKIIPRLLSDEAAEHFIETADLTEYDMSQFKPANFEFAAKDARLNMRLPDSLVKAIKARAAGEGIPYQRYIRRVLEQSLDVKRAKVG